MHLILASVLFMKKRQANVRKTKRPQSASRGGQVLSQPYWCITG